MSFTRGPWWTTEKLSASENHNGWSLWGTIPDEADIPSPCWIADISPVIEHEGNGDPSEQGRANARLISAAPDLLEALKLLPLEAFDKDMDAVDAAEFVDNAGAFYEAMVAARAAISKAEGK